MDCLLDWIGFLGCGDAPVPLSGVYINSLPGITFESMDRIADSDQKTMFNMWSDVQKRAVKRLEMDVPTLFRKRYRMKRVAQTYDLLRLLDKTTTTAAQPEWRGFTIALTFRNNSRIVASAFQMISIQSLALYLHEVEVDDDEIPLPITISIFDLSTGEELYTTELENAEVGWNTIPVNRKFSNYRIAVVYDGTNVDSTRQNIAHDFNYMFSGYFAQLYGQNVCNMQVNGVKTDTLVDSITEDLATKFDSTNGLTGVFSLLCRYDSLVCKNKDSFTTAWWYCLGVELAVERMHSNRTNFYTITAEEAEKLKDYFQVEYEKALQVAIDDIDINTNDACIDCHEQIVVREQHP